MNAAYEEWHKDMARTEGAGEMLYPWHHTVLKLLPDLGGKRVLEIGCGRGDFSMALAQRYPSGQFTAVDFSTAAIAAANSKLAGRDLPIIFQIGDAEALQFDDRWFDYIV